MIITSETINAYADHLAGNEKSPGTIDDYKRSVRRLAEFLDGRELTPELAIEWKQSLTGSSLAAATANLYISAANGLFRFLKREDCLLKRLRVQQKPYRESSRDLSEDEFRRLVNAAKHTGRKKEALILETICGTEIRVSELQLC